MENIILFGAGGHSKVVMDIIDKEGKYFILGLIDDKIKIGTKIWKNYEIIGNFDNLKEISKKVVGGIITIGYNPSREKVVRKIEKDIPEFKFVNTIHPSSQISKDVEIGYGNVIMANTAINSSTKIGNHCIINTGASIDHDNILRDYVAISPGATLGGDVKIGELSWIGLGAKIIQGIEIGEHTVIGAGSVVVKNISPYTVAYGIPAKHIKKRKLDDEYL